MKQRCAAALPDSTTARNTHPLREGHGCKSPTPGRVGARGRFGSLRNQCVRLPTAGIPLTGAKRKFETVYSRSNQEAAACGIL